jgi:hypothetical protein
LNVTLPRDGLSWPPKWRSSVAQDGDDLAARNGQVDALEHRVVLEREMQVADFDQVFRRPLLYAVF